jgi:two-component system chemotaxis response regulator CheY
MVSHTDQQTAISGNGGHQHSALVLDKSNEVRRYLSSLLQRQFACERVVQVDNSQEALGLLKSEQAQFDWIFYDWDLGDIPPQEFLDRVRHEGAGQHAAILMMTRNRERYIVHEALRAGADDYLVKPFTLSILLLKMRRMGALRDRRRHERMSLDDNDDMCLRFENGEETTARLVTVSRVGCLVRAPRCLSRYAHVYDTSTISLQAGEEELSLSGELIRIETDREKAGSREHVLAAFSFKPLTTELSTRLEQFLDRYGLAPATDR